MLHLNEYTKVSPEWAGMLGKDFDGVQKILLDENYVMVSDSSGYHQGHRMVEFRSLYGRVTLFLEKQGSNNWTVFDVFPFASGQDQPENPFN